MSWLGGYKGPPKKSDSEDSREAKRKKLESERQQRAEQRDKLRKQVQAAQEDQEKADQAIQDILALEPEILSGDDTVVSESEVENLLAPDVLSEEILNEAAAMAPEPPLQQYHLRPKMAVTTKKLWITFVQCSVLLTRRMLNSGFHS